METPGAPSLTEQLRKHDATTALLRVNKGSRLIPFVLLLLAAGLFVVHGLSSLGSRKVLEDIFRNACQSVRDKAKVSQPLLTQDGKPRDWTKTPIAAKCVAGSEPIDELARQFSATNLVTTNELQTFLPDEIGGLKAIPVLIGAGIKDYLDALWTAATKYWRSVVQSLFVTAAYALVPGIAGLIYRRAFWVWFGVAFVMLLGIGALASSISSLFGREPASDPVTDTAAALSLLILVQIAVLFARLQSETAHHQAAADHAAHLIAAL